MLNFMYMAIIGSTVHYRDYLKTTFMLVKSCFKIYKACLFWKYCAVGYCSLWDELPSPDTKKLLTKSLDSCLIALANATPLPQVPLEKNYAKTLGSEGAKTSFQIGKSLNQCLFSVSHSVGQCHFMTAENMKILHITLSTELIKNSIY